MKKTLLLFAVALFTTLGLSAQIGQGPKIEFEKDVHDFGTLDQGGDATTEFVFTNTGDAPLLISNARGSCGCTVPVWPREPIAPGKSASIKVRYDSNRVGPINKSVTINTNGSDTPITLRIKGLIKAKPAAPVAVPVNEASPATPVNN